MEEARLQDLLKGNRLVRFGAFELCLDTAELKKHGVRVRLQGKPFQVLCALLERTGHVVTRDDLRNKLWSSNTFVDFESGLNTAVNRLRVALGDSADNPIYIETLARIGYRFIVPITVISESQSGAAAPTNGFLQSAGDNDSVEVNGPIATTRRRWFIADRLWLIPGIAATLSLVATAAILWASRSSRSESVFHQVTFRKGSVLNARFTRDGGSIIYTARWNGAPNRLFVTGAIGSDTRDLGFEKTQLASVSPSGELAIFAPDVLSRPISTSFPWCSLISTKSL